MTFWAAVKEAFLEWFYGGPCQLDIVRRQAQLCKEAERIAQKQYDDYRAGRS